MKKNTRKKIIFAFLILIWMITIFMFSNEDGDSSQETSDVITNFIAGINKNLENNKETISFFIRKLAHFSIYFVGGILLFEFYNAFEISYKKTFCLGALTGILYACFDEIHQLFISGRNGQLMDVYIDSAGIIIALIIMILINKLIRFERNKKWTN